MSAVNLEVGGRHVELQADPGIVEFIRQRIVDRLNAVGPDDLVPMDEANAFVEEAKEKYPKAFVQWLLAQAPRMVAEEMVALRDGATRTEAMFVLRRAQQRRFAKIASEGAPSTVLDRMYNAGNDKWVRLRDMTAADLSASASHQDRKANAALFEAAFLRALAKRLPDAKTCVGEVYREDELAEMRRFPTSMPK